MGSGSLGRVPFVSAVSTGAVAGASVSTGVPLLEQETKQKCQQFISQAEAEAKAFWMQIREDIRDPYMEHERWLQIDSALTGKIYQKIQF